MTINLLSMRLLSGTNRERLPALPVLLCARASPPASLGWRRGCEGASSRPSSGPPGLPAAIRPAPRRGFVPAPDLVGGRDLLIVIEPGPSVGLCPNAPRIAVGARAPSPPNSAPGPSAREASSTRSRRTGPRLLLWPYRLLRRQPAPFPLGEDSSLGDPSAAGDPNRGSCTSGIEACGSDCGATNDGYNADTVAPEGCSYTGTRYDPNRPCRQVSL